MTTVEESLGILEEKFRAIADAIRERRGYTRKLTLADMPPEIRAIGEANTHWRRFDLGGGTTDNDGGVWYSKLYLHDVWGTKDYAKWFCFKLSADGDIQPTWDNQEALVCLVAYDPYSFSAMSAKRVINGNKITTSIKMLRPSCTVSHEEGKSNWSVTLDFGSKIVCYDGRALWRYYVTVDAGY